MRTFSRRAAGTAREPPPSVARPAAPGRDSPQQARADSAPPGVHDLAARWRFRRYQLVKNQGVLVCGVSDIRLPAVPVAAVAEV